MALFKKLFGKGDKQTPKGFSMRRIKAIESLSNNTVMVTFDWKVAFTAGQYVNVAIEVNGKQERRSYSICSRQGDDLAIGIKQVDKGLVSTWFNTEAKENMEIAVGMPEGNFVLPEGAKNCVAIAAGSGITPIMAMAHEIEQNGGSLRLFYGNQKEEDILFRSVQNELKNTSPVYYLSREEKEGFENGRITKDAFTSLIKNDLSILQSDAFLLCGPEAMINDMAETLEMFGVSKDKVLFELFTTPTNTATSSDGDAWKGDTQVTVIIDGEEESFSLNSKKSILEGALDEGLDAPYSCRGGVCSSCKAKVMDGSVKMAINYSLSEQDVEDGFILTCQAHATCESLTVSYDEA